jgi:large subunit ribosomal protein L25
MEKVVLKAAKRSVTGKKVKQLRRKGELPAVIYGHHVDPMAISLNAHDASLALGKITSSSLVTLELDGNEYPALVRETQKDFIKNRLTHVDFLAVSLTEKLRASVRIEMTGLSQAVKDFNAILVNGLTELEVECLPEYLPQRFTVDISTLKEIGDGIYVRDVAIPANVRVLDGPDEMIVVATAPAKEEVVEEVAPVEGVEAAEAEVIEKGKKEEEEAAEESNEKEKEKEKEKK